MAISSRSAMGGRPSGRVARRQALRGRADGRRTSYGFGAGMRMDLSRQIVRFAALVAMCAWLGGFMFYGGAVVPILDEALGSFDAGQITRRVTDRLNLVG